VWERLAMTGLALGAIGLTASGTRLVWSLL
jgi:hypothetical protein